MVQVYAVQWFNCLCVHRWFDNGFIGGADVCVWHGLHMGQVCVVKCCGSVDCGMVHMWFNSGSVVVRMYV